jgi:GNAT superfamily N-acetyltransferase
VLTTGSLAPRLEIRRARPDDARACGRICYEAFYAINTFHHFPPDIASATMAEGFLAWMFAHPRFYCLVAEADRRAVGSNCLDERDAIAGVGPITVDPAAQDHAVGRALMRDVLERAARKGAAGVRLVQAAFHNRSLSLYTKLGFAAREPLSVLRGPALGLRVQGYAVRPATPDDLAACNALCRAVHGHERGGALRDALGAGTARVVERHGRITAYTTLLGFFGHTVAETNDDVQALVGAAEAFAGPGFLLPTRNATLLRWCLERGLRIIEPATLMTLGLYNEPAGAYLPSITY